MEVALLDSLDWRIMYALAAEPRASFRHLAGLAGASEQTVSRRYWHMREVAGLRVIGRVAGWRVGWADWYLRLECLPGTAEMIAMGLARRADTSWVLLASGGSEVICLFQARSAERRDALLLDALPASHRVSRLVAHRVLHEYGGPAGCSSCRRCWGDGGAEARPGGTRVSGGERSAAPGAPSEPRTEASPLPEDDEVNLTAEDEALCERLARDGRATNASLGRQIGWHEATVRRRVHELQQSGALWFDTDLDDRALEPRSHAMLWLSVEPSQLEPVGRVVSRQPEVSFVAAVTGPTNLIAGVVSSKTSDLYAYLTDRLGRVNGIRSVETVPLIRAVKRAGSITDKVAAARPGHRNRSL